MTVRCSRIIGIAASRRVEQVGTHTAEHATSKCLAVVSSFDGVIELISAGESGSRRTESGNGCRIENH